VTLVAASPSGQAARRGIAQNRDGSASGVCLQSNSEGANANSMWQDVKPCDEGALGPTRPLPPLRNWVKSRAGDHPRSRLPVAIASSVIR
jgi:hypothetical protein